MTFAMPNRKTGNGKRETTLTIHVFRFPFSVSRPSVFPQPGLDQRGVDRAISDPGPIGGVLGDCRLQEVGVVPRHRVRLCEPAGCVSALVMSATRLFAPVRTER